MRGRTVVLGAVVGALVVSGVGAAAWAGRLPFADPAARPATVAELRRVSEQVAGTPEQRAATTFLDYVAFQRAMAACYERRGVEYQPADLVLVVADQTELASGTWSGREADPQRAAERGFARRTRAVALVPAPDPTVAGSAGAAATCSQVYPDHAWALRSRVSQDLGETLRRVAQHAGARVETKEYRRCLRRGGVELEPGETPPRLAGSYQDAFTVTDEERAAATVDAECRLGEFNRYLDAVPRRLAQFEAEHAPQLRAQQQRWEAAVVEAAREYDAFAADYPQVDVSAYPR